MIHFATLAYPWRRNHEAVPYPSQPPKQSLSGFLVKQDRLFSRLVIASHHVRHNQPIQLNVTSLLGFFIYYTTDRLGYKCDHYSPSANFKTARTTASMKRPNLPCGMACSLALAGLLLSLQAQAQVQAATPSTASAQKSSAATKTIVPKRELLGRFGLSMASDCGRWTCRCRLQRRWALLRWSVRPLSMACGCYRRPVQSHRCRDAAPHCRSDRGRHHLGGTADANRAAGDVPLGDEPKAAAASL